MGDALARIGATAEVRTVVDIGASDGRWAREAQQHLTADRWLLVEAQAVPHETALQAFAASDPRVSYVIAAAGDREGVIHFDANDPFGGVASETTTGDRDIVVPVSTIDRLVADRGLAGPFLVKLDTHGYELPILEGARETLQQTSVLVVEAYNIRLRDGAPLFHELCAFLNERGFRTVDMCDPLWRPADGALWQMDMVFIPASRPEFTNTSYWP